MAYVLGQPGPQKDLDMLLQNMNLSRDRSKTIAGWRAVVGWSVFGWSVLRCGLGALGAVAALGLACSDDDTDAAGGECIGGEGAVAGAADTHCTADDGSAIVQAIGMCSTGAGEEEEEHEEGEEAEEHEHEEED